MPGGNRTGPLGAGPRTGRAFGYCAGFEAPGYVTAPGGRFFGRGMGMGWGRGRGRGYGMGRGGRGGWQGYGPYAPPAPGPYYGYPDGAPYPHSPQDEEEILRQEAQHLEASLKEIKERLVKLEEKEQEQPQKEKK